MLILALLQFLLGLLNLDTEALIHMTLSRVVVVAKTVACPALENKERIWWKKTSKQADYNR